MNKITRQSVTSLYNKSEKFHRLKVPLFLRNFDAKNGWYNKVTITTMNTNMFLLLFKKKWQQDSQKFLGTK